MMALKLPGTLAILLAATTVAAIGLSTSDANAAKRKAQRTEVRGPMNYSYQSGARTRVYVTRRSWLDAGTEVLPGERKFTDYAIPPGYSYGRSIDRLHQGRQPLSEPWDLGGYPERLPLY